MVVPVDRDTAWAEHGAPDSGSSKSDQRSGASGINTPAVEESGMIGDYCTGLLVYSQTNTQ